MSRILREKRGLAAFGAAWVLIITLTGLALTGLVPGVSAADETGDGAAAPLPKMHSYVVALVHKGPHWRPANSEEVKALEQDHLANIFRLRAQGDMLVSGPFPPIEGQEEQPLGMFIFAVATTEEAEPLLKTDPAIQAGHFRAELLPWLSPTALPTMTTPN